jgi:hypothetical protein
MALRKNQRYLTAAEKNRFIKAVVAPERADTVRVLRELR